MSGQPANPHYHEPRQEQLCPLQQRSASVSVLNTYRVHHHYEQKAKGAYQNMPFAPLDPLTSIVANRTLYSARFVAPPFSAVFTDWLSIMLCMIAAEGSGFRHSSTRILRGSTSFMRSNTPWSFHSAKYPYTVSQGGR
jgi:hypothetical protein